MKMIDVCSVAHLLSISLMVKEVGLHPPARLGNLRIILLSLYPGNSHPSADSRSPPPSQMLMSGWSSPPPPGCRLSTLILEAAVPAGCEGCPSLLTSSSLDRRKRLIMGHLLK